ncbi:uncharacterized protein isoform X2 [Leptinotarsa decemlineata]|uniref:uncharacterized protein isoform X2 n=1 Tax=Leptinotarsa decemlineata TaxID=7539 RepID=UPI003D305088
MTEFHGNEKIGSFGLDEKGEDDEFTLTKLFDIHLKGGYENLHPDLKEVIRSQLQPELKDKLEEHLSTDNSLLEKLENFTESQRSYNIDFTANCKYLVGIDKQSLFVIYRKTQREYFPKAAEKFNVTDTMFLVSMKYNLKCPKNHLWFYVTWKPWEVVGHIFKED